MFMYCWGIMHEWGEEGKIVYSNHRLLEITVCDF